MYVGGIEREAVPKRRGRALALHGPLSPARWPDLLCRNPQTPGAGGGAREGEARARLTWPDRSSGRPKRPPGARTDGRTAEGRAAPRPPPAERPEIAPGARGATGAAARGRPGERNDSELRDVTRLPAGLLKGQAGELFLLDLNQGLPTDSCAESGGSVSKKHKHIKLLFGAR